MEIKEFIEKFAEIFNDTEVTTLTPETKYRDLDGWSSLSALGVMGLAEEEFDVEISGAEMRETNTINDLFDLIMSKR